MTKTPQPGQGGAANVAALEALLTAARENRDAANNRFEAAEAGKRMAMEKNAQLVARIEALTIERTGLAEQIERLTASLAAANSKKSRKSK